MANQGAIVVKPLDYTRLTQPERAQLRSRYIEMQNGLCYHCGEQLSGDPSSDVLARKLDMRRFPTNFLKWPIHLHHNHRTGMTLGAVHAHCNGVLWQYHGE